MSNLWDRISSLRLWIALQLQGDGDVAPVAPKPGELWQLRPKGSPWPEKNYPPVTILDVKDGWVRYDMVSLFKDERMRVSAFVGMYRNVTLSQQ
jgi:hypothetical protein